MADRRGAIISLLMQIGEVDGVLWNAVLGRWGFGFRARGNGGNWVCDGRVWNEGLWLVRCYVGPRWDDGLVTCFGWEMPRYLSACGMIAYA